MIKNVYSNSPYLTVGASMSPNIYGTGPMMGQIRYNPTSSNYEVYDGTNWQIVSNSIPVGLSHDADEGLRWAIQKKREEEELKARMERHPGLKDAYEKFQLMDILTKEEDGLQQST